VCIDVLALFDPGWCKAGVAQHPVSQTHLGILEGILRSIDWLALARQVVELALLHGFADFLIDERFPALHDDCFSLLLIVLLLSLYANQDEFHAKGKDDPNAAKV